MLQERRLLTGGVIAGLGALLGAPASADAGAQRASDAEVAAAVRELVDEIRRQRTECREVTCASVERIRESQKTYFKGQGRFPDVIEIGFDVWSSIWDWLVRTRQRVEPVRLPDGRWGMPFMLTTLVLRHDVANDFVSVGYER